jgi:flagellin-specific chaperone FliS
MTGQTPLEIEPNGKAAREIRQLYAYVQKLIDQIEVEKSTGGEAHTSTRKRVANG